MSYSSVSAAGDNATYTLWFILADGEYNTTQVTAQMQFAGFPVSELTETEKDALFQSFVDYVSAYPGISSDFNASKSFGAGQTCTPTEPE